MRERDENAAIRAVYRQLAARFPSLPDEYVEAAIRVEHAALTGPIRQFVPLLVYKNACIRLTDLQNGVVRASARKRRTPARRAALSA